MEQDEKGIFKRFMAYLAKGLKENPDASETEAEITKADCMTDVSNMTAAIEESLGSIIADTKIPPETKAELLAKSLEEFTADAHSAIEKWARAKTEDHTEEEQNDDYGDEQEPEEKEGVTDLTTTNPEKTSAQGREESTLNPEVKKALEDVRELKKSLELARLTGIAKKYECIGKKADELAPKLYELQKAGDEVYADFIALLDEQADLVTNTVFKEYGSGHGGAGSDLGGAVSEIMKADPNITREQAVIRAYEANPNMDPFTGKLK